MVAYMSLGTGMLVVIAVWAATFLSTTFVGTVFHRWITSNKDLDARSLLSCFWVGWCLLLLFLQVWHLRFPVNISASLIWLGAGAASFIYNRKQVSSAFRGVPASRLLWILAGCGLLMAWLADRAMAPIDLGDTGLYHLASVRWNTAYPIVPGLGNLHGRLAFNSAYFLYAGLFEFPGWKGSAYHFSNGLLLFVLALGILSSFIRLAFDRKEVDRADVFNAGLLVFLPILLFAFPQNLSNDLAVFALGTVLGTQLCRMIFVPSSQAERNGQMWGILLASCAGISLKLSFLALGSASIAVGFFMLLKERRLHDLPALMKTDWTWLIASSMLGVWVLRGVLLSGYPAYPSTLAGQSVVWKVPPEQARSLARAIASWGRAPHQDPEETLADWGWLLPKLKKGLSRFPEFILPLGSAAAGLLLYLVRLRTRPEGDYRDSLLRSISFLAPPAAALILWFLSSPNIRFVGVSFWWLAAGALVILFTEPRAARPAMAAVAFFCLLFLAQNFTTNGFWVRSDSRNGFFPAPIAVTVPFTTRSGLILNVPSEGDQCWDAPLPCTPYPQAELRLIQPGSLSSGFMIAP